MLSSEYQLRLAVSRKIEIGRVTLYVVSGSVKHGVPGYESSPLNMRGQGPSYLLAVPIRGGLRYSQQGRIGLVSPGDYVLVSQKASFELDVETGGEALIVSIPAADLKGRIASVEDHTGRRFEKNQHMSRLLVDLLWDFADIFATNPPPNPEALATEIVSFVALTLGAEDRGFVTDVRNGRYQLRRRIFEFVECNLGDPGLSPRKIAVSSRISLSYLYSLFNDDDTTVGQFIQSKRLQRAYEILVADASGGRTIAEVAYEVGFKNVSHFSRSFSRHFQVAPRDVRPVVRPANERETRRIAADKKPSSGRRALEANAG